MAGGRGWVPIGALHLEFFSEKIIQMENILTLITNALKELTDIVRNTPETIKVAAAVAPPGLSLLGASIEEWSFILACIVSIVVIVEKLPMVVKRATSFVEWMKNALRKR